MNKVDGLDLSAERLSVKLGKAEVGVGTEAEVEVGVKLAEAEREGMGNVYARRREWEGTTVQNLGYEPVDAELCAAPPPTGLCALRSTGLETYEILRNRRTTIIDTGCRI